jgi:dipeptidyl-peptidase-4
MAAISLPAQIVRTRRFTLGVPGQFAVMPDGASVLFLRSRAGHDPLTCLWSLDLTSGTERLLADPAALLGAPSSGKPVPPLSRGALRVIEADGTADCAIATPDDPDDSDGPGDSDDPDVAFGTADLTGTTSLTGSRGYWWAPDGARLLVARVDFTDVPRVPAGRRLGRPRPLRRRAVPRPAHPPVPRHRPSH